jgi:hypothetical protein
MRIRAFFAGFLLALILFLSGLNGISFAEGSFDLSKVSYYDEVKSVLRLTPEQELTLERNGFVCVEIDNASMEGFEPSLQFEDFYYSKVYVNDLPVFVTTDSVLHLFHVVFDCSLRILENQTFYPMLVELTQFAFNTSKSEYTSIVHDGSAKYWAVRNSTVYFGVALSLLTNSTVDVPSELSNDVAFYLDNVYADDLQFLPAGQWILPVSPFEVDVQYDFTQFKVRGHYVGDPQLERYFRAMMWYGQFPVLVPRSDERYLWDAPHFDEATVVYIRDILRSNAQCFADWLHLYNVTSALIGESDSINLLTLETALHRVFGDSEQYLDLVVEGSGLKALKEELSKPEYDQRILSQALISGTPGAVLPRYPLVFQFMGQRFVPDSYMFQMLCWDKVGYDDKWERRILPKGLDVFAVLGSERAYQLLIPDFAFQYFEGNLTALKQAFAGLQEEDWTHSSYMAWVYALQSLVNVQYDSSYPEFMTSLAWQDEKLCTALSSWAQLRHDTILYAKQTYIPGYLCSYPEAFAEPNPTFYSRMQQLCEQTINAVNLLSPGIVPDVIDHSLGTLRNVTQSLETISTKELNQEALSQDEVDFLKGLVYGCGSGGPVGWYFDTIRWIAWVANANSILEAPVIADVATFPPGDMDYPPQILHVGVGNVNALVVLFPKPDGTLTAAVGPAFSYYEFRLIGTERLNDNEWKDMLTWSNRSAYVPEWFKDVYGQADPWGAPEFPNVGLVPVLVVLTLVLIAVTRRIKVKRSGSGKRVAGFVSLVA